MFPVQLTTRGFLNHVILIKDWLIHCYMTKQYIRRFLYRGLPLAATSIAIATLLCLFTYQASCSSYNPENNLKASWSTRENISWVAFDCDRRIAPGSQHSYFRHDLWRIWRTLPPRALQWSHRHRTKIQELANCVLAVFFCNMRNAHGESTDPHLWVDSVRIRSW